MVFPNLPLRKIIETLLPLLEKCKCVYSRTLPVLTYRKLLEDITLFKPEDEKVKACSVVKEILPNGGIKINVIYLGADKQPIWASADGKEYSFAIPTKKLDDELISTFGEKNIIFFE